MPEGMPTVREEVDLYSLTPLHLACQKGRAETVTLLLKHGASANTRTKIQLTPLHCAVSSGNARAVALILDAKGTDVDGVERYGQTPLHLAAYYGYGDIARELLDKGANRELRIPHSNMTALMVAQERRTTSVVKVLSEYEGKAVPATGAKTSK